MQRHSLSHAQPSTYFNDRQHFDDDDMQEECAYICHLFSACVQHVLYLSSEILAC